MTLKQVTEALVFASQKPLTPKEIISALKSAALDSEDADILAFAKAREEDILAVLGDISNELRESGRAFQLIERANGWTMVSDPLCGLWVRQLYPESKPSRLSGPALETLAIIAYRQPIMRADIEAVRGVAVDGMVQSLLERGLIRIAGRADIPGRPLLYETTEVFLVHFGLKSVEDLPNAGELRRINLPTAPVPEETKAEKPEKPAKPAKPAKASKAEKAEPAPLQEAAVAEEPTPEAAPAVNESAAEAPAEVTPAEAAPAPADSESAPAENTEVP